jgi:hypothetical protein
VIELPSEQPLRKKVVEEPNVYLRRYREAWKNFVLALAEKKREQQQKPEAS